MASHEQSYRAGETKGKTEVLIFNFLFGIKPFSMYSITSLFLLKKGKGESEAGQSWAEGRRSKGENEGCSPRSKGQDRWDSPICKAEGPRDDWIRDRPLRPLEWPRKKRISQPTIAIVMSSKALLFCSTNKNENKNKNDVNVSLSLIPCILVTTF